MKNIFDPIYIKEEPILFTIFVLLMLLIMILTIIFVKKELGKKK